MSAVVKIVRAEVRPARRKLKRGFRAHLIGGNNEVVFTSEVYNDKRDAVAAAAAVTMNVKDET